MSAEFRNAIRAAGMEPPDNFERGKFHRYPGVDKRKGNEDGWCILFDHDDSYGVEGGCFGDWSSGGFSENWQEKRDKPFSKSERIAFTRRVKETRKRAEAERQKQHEDALKRANAIWQGAKKVPCDFPYLVRKKVRSYGIRKSKNRLILPLRDTKGMLYSLLFIAEDGDKKYLKGGAKQGHFHTIGELKDRIFIAEGYATAASIHKVTKQMVIVAGDKGNLIHVAKVIRDKYPDVEIILAADNDQFTKDNPGVTKATEAAQAINGLVTIPVFKDLSTEPTDFNDSSILEGEEVVREQLSITSAPSWEVPLPLTAKIEPEPYPIDALPDTLRSAVEEVCAFVKAPVPLVASSALGALSLAVQAHADVKRAEKLKGPISLFLITIADSGERKSTCDNFFTQAIREYEVRQAEEVKPLIIDYKAAIKSWEAKCGGIKDKIRQLAKTEKSTRDQETALRELEHDKPESPRVPRLIYGDVTPEALKWILAKSWPSGGVISSEGGLVLGAHGMGKESVMRNLATLNQLWDGADIATERRTSESFTVRGARLTIALQVQEVTLRSFFDRSGGLARGSGFLARFLMAWPESTQGQRPFTDPPETWPALAKFNQRITAILEQEIPIDEDGALTPPVIPLAVDTKTAWIMFHDAIESELRSGGELYDVRDVASKIADNAVRIATLFQKFEHGAGGAIALAEFEGASRIAAWHLHEARRFYGELALPEEQANTVQLDSWLLDYCRRENTNIISRRKIQQYVTPGHIRRKAVLDDALLELVDYKRINLVQDGKQKEIHINPALLKGSM